MQDLLRGSYFCMLYNAVEGTTCFMICSRALFLHTSHWYKAYEKRREVTHSKRVDTLRVSKGISVKVRHLVRGNKR